MAPLTGFRVPWAVQMDKYFLSDKASILSCRCEHFKFLFSADRVVQNPAVPRIPQQPFKAELDQLPFMKEITKAIEHLRSGKVAGIDGIPLDLRKEGRPGLHCKLHELIIGFWGAGQTPFLSLQCNHHYHVQKMRE